MLVDKANLTSGRAELPDPEVRDRVRDLRLSSVAVTTLVKTFFCHSFIGIPRQTKIQNITDLSTDTMIG